MKIDLLSSKAVFFFADLFRVKVQSYIVTADSTALKFIMILSMDRLQAVTMKTDESSVSK